MRTQLSIAILLLLAAPSWAAQDKPKHYRWVDDSGHTHVSDRVPASASRFGYQVIDKYGRVLRTVEGQKSEAERTEEARLAAQREQAKENERKDHNLLATYPSEESLIQAQDARETMLTQRIESTRINMKSQLGSLADLLATASGLQQDGKAVPADLENKINKQRAVIRSQRESIQRSEAELKQARIDHTATLDRYRKLTAQRRKSRSKN